MRAERGGVDTGGDFVHNIGLSNVEFHEADAPILFHYRRQSIDTGGAGQYRGGVGLEEAWTPHGIDRIDLYYQHKDNPQVPLADSLGAFDALRREGKIAAVGLSNFGPVRIDQAVATPPSGMSIA